MMHAANNKQVIEEIEKREGRSILELIDIQNSKMEAKQRDKMRTSVLQSPHLTIAQRNRGFCSCGSRYKTIFIRDDFIVLCKRTNKPPKNCRLLFPSK